MLLFLGLPLSRWTEGKLMDARESSYLYRLCVCLVAESQLVSIGWRRVMVILGFFVVHSLVVDSVPTDAHTKNISHISA